MKNVFNVMDTRLGRVLLQETDEYWYINVGRRDLSINKKTGEIDGSGSYVGEELLPWEVEYKEYMEKLEE